MANMYSQIYIQIVIVVRGRQNLIQTNWRDELFKYISGIIKNKGQKPIIVNGVGDHVHIFIGLKPSMAISDLIRDIKCNATNFINKNRFVMGKFEWQEGAGVFSYSHSQINAVYKYIANQKNHHKKRTFREEYLEFLTKNEIEFKNEYLFEFYE